ncbi:substrate-binding domain-containing protein [Paenibacillus hunanensis]|uniref:substrate-binding domain-containing protein n=1 Tax=Paenibacillus hunanensis TaxID=539262 RepID=UPI0020266CC5|nr:substrate-binding domain-containing protein [Paenibacillus hunanensis]MCL9662890.1 substrate-binding domain-containing protein [Paenibacillus hunanensis]
MTKKRLIPMLIVASLLVLLLSACTAAPVSEPSTSPAATDAAATTTGAGSEIGISIFDMSDKFVSYITQGMKVAATKNNIKATYVDAANNSSQQVQQVAAMIKSGVRAIVLIPTDEASATSSIELANKANIPIVVVNRYYPSVDNATAYVGSDSLTAGTMQMQEVAKLLKGKGNVAIMNGEMGTEAQAKRTEGNKQVISKNPGIKVVLEDTANYDRAQGMALMGKWLASGTPIQAVVSNNDEMIIGAILAAQLENKDKDIIFAGVDATMDALEFMKAGRLQVTVFQNAPEQGAAAIKAASDAAAGKTVEKQIMVPYELVTKDNVEKYIAKWQ